MERHGAFFVILCLAVCLIAVENAPCKPCFGCGNGFCDYPAEDCRSCPQDCGICPSCTSRCGNNVCERGESNCSCPQDCGVCCVDGVCREDRGENWQNCPSDCAVNIAGTLLDVDTSAPLTGSVTCYESSWSIGPAAATKGVWGFNKVAPGKYLCEGSAVCYENNNVPVSAYPLSCPSNVAIPLKFRYASLGGVTRDIDTLQPLANVRVQCTSAAQNTTVHLSGVEGQFWFDNILPGVWTCRGELDGYAPGVFTVNVSCGDTIIQDLYLRALGGAIQGWVINGENNQGIPGATIVCTRPANLPAVQATAGTNNVGFYAVPSYPAGPVSCTASIPLYTSETKSGTVPKGGILVLNFTLTPLPATLSGNATDGPSGAGLPGTSISCTPVYSNFSNNAVVRASTTSNAGSYSYNPIVAAFYQCTASKPGWVSANGSILVPPGSNSILNFILNPLPSGIIGTVTTVSGGLLNSIATVNCVFDATAGQPALSPVQTSTTSANYSFPAFTIKNVNVMTLTFTCTASAAGYQSVTQSSSVVRGQVAIVPFVLPELPGALTGITYDNATGTPLPGTTVTCTGLPTLSTNSTGGYFHASVASGNVTCTATRTGWFPGTGSVIIRNGQLSVLNIPLVAQPAGIIGAVYDSASFVGINGVTVSCVFVNPAQPSLSGTTAGNGNFSFNPLTLVDLTTNSFQFNCSATAPGYFPGSAIATVTRGQVVYVPIPLVVQPAAITGVVTDSRTGQALSGATVFCTGPSGQLATLTTNSTGGYYYGPVGAGRYTCTASKTGWSTNSNSANVPSASLTVINIALDPLPAVIIGAVYDSATLVGINGASVSCVFVNPTQPSLANTTAGNGNFSFNPVYLVDLTANSFQFNCSASAPGYFPGFTIATVTRGQTVYVPIPLGVQPAAITGIVTDSRFGFVLVGATVFCTGPSGQLTTLTTNSTGGYYYSNVGAGRYTCTASKTGWSTNSSSANVPSASLTVINIALDPLPAAITGVTLESGTRALITGANVVCTWASGTLAALPAAVTDSNAAFNYTNIYINDPAVTSVNFTCVGTAVGYGSGSVTGFITRGATTRVEILLLLLGIEVTVRDLSNGNVTITNATVVCSGTNGGFGTQTRVTNSTGIVSHARTPVDTYTCTGSKTGYTSDSATFNVVATSGIVRITLYLELQLDTIKIVTLGFGSATNIYELDSAPTCQVFSNTTNSVVYPSQQVYQSVDYDNTTSKNGIILKIATPVRLFITCSLVLHVSGPVRTYLESTNSSTVIKVYLIPQPSQIQGYITNSTSPLQGASAQLISSSGTTSVSNVSLANGFYLLPNLGVGAFTLRISLNGYIPVSLAVNVTKLGQLIIRNFTLESRTTGSLSGSVNVVSGATSNPIAGALVTIFINTVPPYTNSTRSDSKGQFNFPSIPPSTALLKYNVTASLDGYNSGSTTTDVFLSDNTLTSPLLLTQRQGTVNGYVFGQKAGQQPVLITTELIQVCIFALGKTVPTAGADPCKGNDGNYNIAQGTGGFYTITNVPEGQYTMFAWSSINAFAQTTVPNPITILQGPALIQNITMTDLRKKRQL